jgi:hypothetical protein
MGSWVTPARRWLSRALDRHRRPRKNAWRGDDPHPNHCRVAQVLFHLVSWRNRSTQRGDSDLPASTFEGSEATPSPLTDPGRNWVDLFTIVSGSLIDPSRLSNRLYQRRLVLAAALLFVACGVVSFGLGARWLALGLILVGIAVYVTMRFRRIPALALLAVLAVVTLFVIPLDLGHGSSAATQPATCQWLSNSEVTTALGPGAVTGKSPTSTHCTWNSSPHPSVKRHAATQLSLVITYPTVMPSPAAADQEVSTVGLRAWTRSTCDLSTCAETLFVVLSRGFVTISLSSAGTNPSTWQPKATRDARHLIELGTLVAPRVSPPD